MCSYRNVPFLEYALFGMFLFWNMPFLECAFFGMCSFWNVPLLEYALFGIWSFWNEHNLDLLKMESVEFGMWSKFVFPNIFVSNFFVIGLMCCNASCAVGNKKKRFLNVQIFSSFWSRSGGKRDVGVEREGFVYKIESACTSKACLCQKQLSYIKPHSTLGSLSLFCL